MDENHLLPPRASRWFFYGVFMCEDCEENDIINHPAHYKSDSGLEVIDIIESFDMNFHLGNAIKYILRAGKKGDYKQDLHKAVWYLQREVERSFPDC
jgi:Protein of unknwon function (DUF3310)